MCECPIHPQGRRSIYMIDFESGPSDTYLQRLLNIGNILRKLFQLSYGPLTYGLRITAILVVPGLIILKSIKLSIWCCNQDMSLTKLTTK